MDFKELRESYVIFITQNDYFGYGLPIYTVNRYLEELGIVFRDGSHIIYVNGSYRGNDEIGKLMYDFACKDSKDMHYPELAEGVKHFKEEGGRELMCEAVEAYAAKKAEEAAKKAAEEAAKKAAEEAAIKTTIEDAVSYGIEKERILEKVTQKYGISRETAEELYNTYVGLEA